MLETAGDSAAVERAIAVLEPFVSEAKKARMAAVLARRTAHFRVVLEDIYQTHNASAAMRSCECFGVQHLHVIEQLYPYSLNPDVDMGSRKWVTLHRHREPGADNRRACLDALRAAGLRIVATTPDPAATPLPAFPVDRPFALCFGTEKDGLSDTLLHEADERLRIPMEGFTESFNISVSVALCLYDLTTRLRNSSAPWQLAPDDRRRVHRDWLRRAVRHADSILRRAGV